MSSYLTPNNFKALYVELGLGEELCGNIAPLHTAYPNAERCWLPSETDMQMALSTVKNW
jgi:hypothetical protein